MKKINWDKLFPVEKTEIEKILLKEEYKAERFISVIRVILLAIILLEMLLVGLITKEHSTLKIVPVFSGLLVFSLLMMLDTIIFGSKRYYHFFTRLFKYFIILVDTFIVGLLTYFLISTTPQGQQNPWGMSLVFLGFDTILFVTTIFRYSKIASIYLGVVSVLCFVGLSFYMNHYQNLLELVIYQGSYNMAFEITFWVIVSLSILSTILNKNVWAILVKNKKQEQLSRFLPETIVNDILNGNKEISLGGSKQQVTILFSDIRNFTAMSENQDPEEVINFLNSYFNDMIEILFRYNGTLDKTMGDGMMAIFGVPFSTGNDADHAVSTAIDMIRKIQAFNGLREIQGQEPIRIGVGIHTGEVVVGNVGTARRMEYTVIGDTVNTASRLETLNKQFGTSIIISQATRDALKQDYAIQPLETVPIKGKQNQVQIYQVDPGV